MNGQPIGWGSFVRNSVFARDTLTLTFGTVVSQAIAVGVTPILTRLFEPSQFGSMAIFLAVVAIVSTMVTLRFETAILISEAESESLALVRLTLYLSAVIGTILLGISLGMPLHLRDSIGLSPVGNLLPLAVVTGVATAIIAIGSNWLNRQRSYALMARLRILQAGVNSGIAIALGFVGLRSGLLIAQTVALVLCSGIVLSLLSPRLQGLKSSELRAAAESHRAAPTFLLPAALLDVFTIQLPVLLIIAWFGRDAGGQFSMAWRVLGMPMTIVGAAVGQVFLQRFTETWPDVARSRSLLRRTWIGLATLGLAPTLLFMAWGGPLFAFVFGPKWAQAGRMAGLIAPMMLAMLISAPTSGVYQILSLQKYSLAFGFSFIFYRTASLYLGFVTNDIANGLIALAACEIMAIIVYNVILLKKLGHS